MVTGGGGLLGGARGKGDGLDAGGGDDGGGLGFVAAAAAAGLLDREGLRVLEDVRVALEPEDEAVELLAAEVRVDGPLVGLGGVGDAACQYVREIATEHARHSNTQYAVGKEGEEEDAYWRCR